MNEKIKIDREKFTTTLSQKHKKRLTILTAFFGEKGKNALLEKLIDEKWECFKNAMENQ